MIKKVSLAVLFVLLSATASYSGNSYPVGTEMEYLGNGRCKIRGVYQDCSDDNNSNSSYYYEETTTYSQPEGDNLVRGVDNSTLVDLIVEIVSSIGEALEDDEPKKQSSSNVSYSKPKKQSSSNVYYSKPKKQLSKKKKRK